MFSDMEYIKSLYYMGIDALFYRDTETQRAILIHIMKEIPLSIDNTARSYTANTYASAPLKPVEQLSAESVAVNLRAYCQALCDAIYNGRPRVDFTAIEILRRNICNFTGATVLWNSGNDTLTVSDLLKVISHSLSCVELLTSMDTSQQRRATTALHGLDLLLSNNTKEIDCIGYAVEVFGSISEQMTTNQDIKRNIIGLETMLSLGIDFFKPKLQ